VVYGHLGRKRSPDTTRKHGGKQEPDGVLQVYKNYFYVDKSQKSRYFKGRGRVVRKLKTDKTLL
jgi:hypothetical protein